MDYHHCHILSANIYRQKFIYVNIVGKNLSQQDIIAKHSVVQNVIRPMTKAKKISNMDWIKEIDYNKFLDGDLKIVVDIVGIDNFIKLFKVFSKTAVYFSERPLMEMKQEFIRKYFGSKSEKELARLLGVSERLVYKIGAQKLTLNNQQKLFED